MKKKSKLGIAHEYNLYNILESLGYVTVEEPIVEQEEPLEEGPMGDKQAKAKSDLIKRRMGMVEDRLLTLKKALEKYDSNPMKYTPQLQNVKTEANAIRQLGQIMHKMAQDLEKMHK